MQIQVVTEEGRQVSDPFLVRPSSSTTITATGSGQAASKVPRIW